MHNIHQVHNKEMYRSKYWYQSYFFANKMNATGIKTPKSSYTTIQQAHIEVCSQT